MRILAFADEPPHGPIAELVAAYEPDVIVLLGDLEPAWTEGLESVELPKLGVLGNHDAEDALATVGAEDLQLRRGGGGGVRFSGFGGSPRYSRGGGEGGDPKGGGKLVAPPPPA